jgi:uracil phosphoribosyltransferase
MTYCVGVASTYFIDHPLVADKIRQLRDEKTSNADFLRLAGEIARFVAYEAFRDAKVSPTTVDTPVVKGAPAVKADTQYIIIPILRAGLGMSPAAQEILPVHRVCLMGLRRNEETLLPDVYLDGVPEDLGGAPIVICDPMLATGGSLVCVLDIIAQRNPGPVTVLCLLAAQPGLDYVLSKYPDIKIFGAALDAKLTDVGYITPGLGDAGDRLFGAPVR